MSILVATPCPRLSMNIRPSYHRWFLKQMLSSVSEITTTASRPLLTPIYLWTGQSAQLQEEPQEQSLPHMIDSRDGLGRIEKFCGLSRVVKVWS
jgi:hypothetical protein